MHTRMLRNPHILFCTKILIRHTESNSNRRKEKRKREQRIKKCTIQYCLFYNIRNIRVRPAAVAAMVVVVVAAAPHTPLNNTEYEVHLSIWTILQLSVELRFDFQLPLSCVDAQTCSCNFCRHRRCGHCYCCCCQSQKVRVLVTLRFSHRRHR